MGRKTSLFSLAVIALILVSAATAYFHYRYALSQQAGQLLRWSEFYYTTLKEPEPDHSPNASELDIHGFYLRLAKRSEDGLQVLWENNRQFPSGNLLEALKGHKQVKALKWQEQQYQVVSMPLPGGRGFILAVSTEALKEHSGMLGLWLFLVNLLLLIIIVLVNPRLLGGVSDRGEPWAEAWEHMTGIAFQVSKSHFLLNVNRRFNDIFGNEDFRKFEDLLLPDEKPLILGYLKQSEDAGVEIDFECSLVDQLGESGRWALHVKPWHGESQPGLLITGDDISKRHHMELELRGEQQRVSAYFDSMQTLLVICDKYGNIERINQQMQAMLGLEQEQLIGHSFRNVLPKNELPRLLTMWRELVTTETSTLSLECPLISANGKESTISWRITKIIDPDSGRVEVVLAGLDISEAVATRIALEVANRRIRETLSQAEQANRSKSIFLASMSHEIRTPMNGILGAAELLLEGHLEDEQRSYLEIIHNSSNVLLEIINDVLDLSKIESGNLEIEHIHFNLDEMLRDLYQLFAEPARRKNLALVYLYDSNLPAQWQGDPKRTRQIITNLISNALKFTEDGHIEIRVSGHQADRGIYNLEISVIDTGIGISEDKLEQVFSAFRQADSSTSRKYGGTGLGLTISRHLAEAMDGDIQITSEFGHGSKFTLQLPMRASDGNTVESPVEKIVEVEAEKLSGMVLVAEDNQVNQRIAEKMLQRLGLKCHIVENGEQAVAEVLNKDYDLVLMDVNMPVLDGISATERIRDLSYPKSQVPIIALTANAMMEDRNRCLEAGMNGFVSKPIKLDLLKQAIASLLQKA